MEWVKPASQIVVGLFTGRRLNWFGAPTDSPIVDSLRVCNVHMQMDLRRPIRRCPSADHHNTVVDAQLCMLERAVWPIEAPE